MFALVARIFMSFRRQRAASLKADFTGGTLSSCPSELLFGGRMHPMDSHFKTGEAVTGRKARLARARPERQRVNAFRSPSP